MQFPKLTFSCFFPPHLLLYRKCTTEGRRTRRPVSGSGFYKEVQSVSNLQKELWSKSYLEYEVGSVPRPKPFILPGSLTPSSPLNRKGPWVRHQALLAQVNLRSPAIEASSLEMINTPKSHRERGVARCGHRRGFLDGFLVFCFPKCSLHTKAWSQPGRWTGNGLSGHQSARVGRWLTIPHRGTSTT